MCVCSWLCAVCAWREVLEGHKISRRCPIHTDTRYDKYINDDDILHTFLTIFLWKFYVCLKLQFLLNFSPNIFVNIFVGLCLQHFHIFLLWLLFFFSVLSLWCFYNFSRLSLKRLSVCPYLWCFVYFPQQYFFARFQDRHRLHFLNNTLHMISHMFTPVMSLHF